jgi:hypothetical protein
LVFITDNLEKILSLKNPLLAMLCKFLGLLSNVGKLPSSSFHICAVRFQGAYRVRAFPTTLDGAHASEES